MEHLGDITKISGKDAPVVNVIIGGSPCQDLSIAGKRAGLAGARSGLFMKQIRIIKEMRKTDEDRGRKGTDVRPRFMVWENVPGAFSSNGGEDFRAVLEETVQIADENALIPRPANGKWRASGCILGDGFSLAWRVLDAQFWGVPQRRRRIALVADFGGHTAPEILFERESVPRDPAESGTARESAAGDAADCVGITNRGGSTGGVSETLRACSHGALPMVADGVATADADPLQDTAICVQGNCIDRADTAGCNGKGWTEDVSYTLNTIDRHAVCIGNGQANQLRLSDKAGTLSCVHDQQAVLCAAVDCRHWMENTGVNGTLQAKSNGGYSCNMQNVVRQKYCVRRLTPLECERLQGYPEIVEANVAEMNKDEFIALNLASRQIIADCKNGKVYSTKGPGGIALTEPKELTGTIINGYKVISIRNGTVKKQCRAHRIIWIAQNGIIPNGMVVDHINNDKLDNRIENLQLLTAENNSTKAANDGLYLSGDKSPSSVLPECKRIEIVLWHQTGAFTLRQLAEKYGISKSRVHQIIKTHGYTDIGEWVDTGGKVHKECADTARYKALGNSIALPPWRYVLQKLSLCCGGDWTMASLFDGIGGFPLLWEQLNGAGTCVWASEIEEFPMAVTKYHFGGK